MPSESTYALILPLLAQDGGLGSILQSPLPMLVIIGVLFYVILIRPERRKQAELKGMLERLKKNDRVVTIGGMFGTVVNVQKGAEDITIRIDENTRVRVLRSAIARVLTQEEASGKPDEKKPD